MVYFAPMLLIPVIYIRGGATLKPVGAGGPSVTSDPIELARVWSKSGAELTHVVDLETPASGPSPNLSILKKIRDEIKVGLVVEGNIRSIDTAEKYFQIGAERITLGAIAYQKPAFLSELCQKFPKKVAVNLDVRRGRVVIKGWTVATNKTSLDYVKQLKEAGVTMLYYSDSDEEGLIKPADFGRMRDFLRKALIKIVHTTDITNTTELEQLIMLESYGLEGTLLSKSLYEGRLDLEGTITFSKEYSRSGLDEPTYIEGGTK